MTSQKPTAREVAKMLGIQLPMRDGIKFSSPIRPDNKPSCWIHNGRIFDGSTGENFDGIGLYAAVKGLSNGEAFRRLCGSSRANGEVHTPKQKTVKPVEFPKPYEWRDSKPFVSALARSRSLPVGAIELAGVFAKVLCFSRIFDTNVWILRDGSGIGWEARRIDREEFPAVGSLGPRKSHAKGQGFKSWPLGLLPQGIPEHLHRRLPIVLCEGGPDLLTLYAILARNFGKPEFLPCAMMGKSASINADALELMRHRRVVIVGHPDAKESIAKWASQLASVCAEPRPFILKVHDLNDMIEASPEDFSAVESHIYSQLL